MSKNLESLWADKLNVADRCAYIGGDMFAIVWDANKQELTGLNASGRSPQSLDLQYFKDQGLDSIPPRGPLPVSVPPERIAVVVLALLVKLAVPPAISVGLVTL